MILLIKGFLTKPFFSNFPHFTFISWRLKWPKNQPMFPTHFEDIKGKYFENEGIDVINNDITYLMGF